MCPRTPLGEALRHKFSGLYYFFFCPWASLNPVAPLLIFLSLRPDIFLDDITANRCVAIWDCRSLGVIMLGSEFASAAVDVSKRIINQLIGDFREGFVPSVNDPLPKASVPSGSSTFKTSEFDDGGKDGSGKAGHGRYDISLLTEDHPFCALRLFKDDRVFAAVPRDARLEGDWFGEKVVSSSEGEDGGYKGQWLMGGLLCILVLGDSNTPVDRACK
jgi:hypothetical protein